MKSLLAAILLFGWPVQSFAECHWQVHGPTPLAPAYLPQGLSHDDRGVILALYSKRNTPRVVFYRYDTTWRRLAGNPGPLRHTSGILPFGQDHILIDYETGLIGLAHFGPNAYDLKAVFSTGERRISSGFLFHDAGTDYLIVSTFGVLGRHLWFNLADLTAHRAAGGTLTAARTTQASAFVQGNVRLQDGTVLEATNKIGADTVNVLSFRPDRQDFGKSFSLKYPLKYIEDLTVFNGRLYTTDEKDFALVSRSLSQECATQRQVRDGS
ncbi:MAG: hypothetical protein MK160_05660 [Rhodobacteraceae bacterium]|nr:hypothetical protein [Paracoccaceae bacterium]